jgi:hypothetical protein
VGEFAVLDAPVPSPEPVVEPVVEPGRPSLFDQDAVAEVAPAVVATPPAFVLPPRPDPPALVAPTAIYGTERDKTEEPPEPEPEPEPVEPEPVAVEPEPEPQPVEPEPAPQAVAQLSHRTVLREPPLVVTPQPASSWRERALAGGVLAVVVALLGAGAFAFADRSKPGVKKPASASAKVAHSEVTVPPATGITAGWVQQENAKEGTNAWRLEPGHNKGIEGFADAVSATDGQAVTLYVSTKASSFHVEAYRMGYYHGDGGRLVWKSDKIPGKKQAAPSIEPKTHMVETEWSPSVTVRITSDFVQGDYLFKLVGDGDEQQYIPLTVRDDNSTAAFVVQNAVTTWQAYNLWGGADLYEGQLPGGKGSSFDARSRVVSFDRPYKIGDGSGDFLGNEFPLVSFAESLGLDLTYWTDVDLHRRPELLTRHKALLTLGHDEYWSWAMRDGAEGARDQGVNLVFFGANAAFRQIRLEDSPLGLYRREVNYKRGNEDPMRLINPKYTTADFRQPPVNRPESAMIGALYECNPVKADFVVTNPSAWVFAGTGLSMGDKINGLVGSEYDRYTPGPATPTNLEVLAHSPVRCRGKASYSDMTYYTAPSGGAVLATGTNLWVPKLGSDDDVKKITTNILKAFGAGPAGKAHEPRPNTKDLPKVPLSSSADSTTSTTGARRAGTTGSTTSTTRRPGGLTSTTKALPTSTTTELPVDPNPP